MKEYKKSQFGWIVGEHFPGHSYSIFNPKREKLSFLIPEEIWDGLASAVERADNYRKSRDHFRESRDAEKAKAAEMMHRITDGQKHLVYDLNLENKFLMDEVSKLEQDVRVYKTTAVFAGLFSVLCLLTHYLI